MNLNTAVVTGNLTADPELREFGSGQRLCRLRVAVNERTKQDGEWVERANFFTVTAFGAQAESCATYLAKGRAVAVQGRLRWREYEGAGGERREAVEIVASQVQFLGSGRAPQNGGPADGGEAAPQPAGRQATEARGDDDDLPF
jgi:single-strand DNA-binding protein